MNKQKRYEYKIYDKNGNFITSWQDVLNEPEFSSQINGGLGSLRVVLKRPFGDFGEGEDVWFENKLELSVYDKENPTEGKLIYTGRLTEYSPSFGDKENVEVTFLGYITELSDRYVRSITASGSIDNVRLVASGTGVELGGFFGHIDYDLGYDSVAGVDYRYLYSSFISAHNNFSGAGMQIARKANVQKYGTIGIVEAGYRTGVDRFGNSVGYYSPTNNVLASGIFDAEALPLETAFDMPNNVNFYPVTNVSFDKVVPAVKGKNYFVYVAGSGISVAGENSFGGYGDIAFRSTVSPSEAPFTSSNLGYVLITGPSYYFTNAGRVSYFTNLAPEYLSKDPTDIAEDIITNNYSGTVQWEESNQQTGYTVSYLFNKIKVIDAIKKCIELADENWFYFIGADNKLKFRQKDYNTIHHTLRLGFEIKSCKPVKSANELYTRALLYGGSAQGEAELFLQDDWSWLNDEYSIREHLISDGRVKEQSTGYQFTKTFLGAHSRPTTYMNITVMDSNGSEKYGYDIESFEPGQLVRIIDPNSDNFQSQEGILDAGFVLDETELDVADKNMFNEPLQIMKINYRGSEAVIELGKILDDAPRRIEDINRDAQDNGTRRAPAG